MKLELPLKKVRFKLFRRYLFSFNILIFKDKLGDLKKNFIE
jgi:hypothetical protein